MTNPAASSILDVVWGAATCLVWLPAAGRRAGRLAESRLGPLQADEHLHFLQRAQGVRERCSPYCRCPGARYARGALRRTVTPLPAPSSMRFSSRDLKRRMRYLLADEVGLGKTIEAGLILRELENPGAGASDAGCGPCRAGHAVGSGRDADPLSAKTSGSSPRELVGPAPGQRPRRGREPWRMQDQVICPLDSVKPRRRTARLESVSSSPGINRERFEDLVSAGWDLIIIDEAHRLGGSTDQVARSVSERPWDRRRRTCSTERDSSPRQDGRLPPTDVVCSIP